MYALVYTPLTSEIAWSLGRSAVPSPTRHFTLSMDLAVPLDPQEVVWSSRGLLLNHAALKRLSLLMSGRLGQTMSKGVLETRPRGASLTTRTVPFRVVVITWSSQSSQSVGYIGSSFVVFGL